MRVAPITIARPGDAFRKPDRAKADTVSAPHIEDGMVSDEPALFCGDVERGAHREEYRAVGLLHAELPGDDATIDKPIEPRRLQLSPLPGSLAIGDYADWNASGPKSRDLFGHTKSQSRLRPCKIRKVA